MHSHSKAQALPLHLQTTKTVNLVTLTFLSKLMVPTMYIMEEYGYIFVYKVTTIYLPSAEKSL